MAKNGKSKGKGSRKSRAESVTGKKAAAVETRSGLSLPEPVGLSEDDVNTHVRAIKAAMEKKDTAVSLLRGANKAAAALHPELPGAIKESIAAERANPEKLKARLEVLGITLKATGSPIQLNVFDTLAGDTMEQIFKRYEAMGLRGETLVNKYPEGSGLAAEALRGWRSGTAKNMGMALEEFEAELVDKDGTGDSDHDATDPKPEGAGEPWPDDQQISETREAEAVH